MAHVQSLGLHEPSALQYLIDESLLPNESSESSYTWHVYPVCDFAGNQITEDEILQTKNCVVWSRGGIVKRAFSLDIEDEEILQSFITRFPASKAFGHRHAGIENLFDLDYNANTHAKESFSTTLESSQQARSEALVVILKTKAHVYFLTGDTHIVSIPFEVGRAFPTPQGCLLQRKSPASSVRAAALSAPQNSFISSRLTSSLTRSQQMTLKITTDAAPSLTLSPGAEHVTMPSTSNSGYTPSVFSLTNPQAELGVAVIDSRMEGSSRYEQHFDPAEEILYVSRDSEIVSSPTTRLEPLLLAVSWNSTSGMYTVWKVRHRHRGKYDSRTKARKPSREIHGIRRRSSNMLRITGSTTPIGPGLGESRESLGPQLGRSLPEAHLSHRRDENKTSEIENLATDLGHDFADVGVQTRAARRVSSMLARTDLSMGPDRAPNGFTSNNAKRKSLNRAGARGESIGDCRDRQSFGPRPSASFPGVGSFMTDKTSFGVEPVDRLLAGLSSGVDFEGFDKIGLDDGLSELPAEVVLSKVHSIHSSEPIPATQSSKERIRVFTLTTNPSGHSGSSTIKSLSVCIMNSRKAELSVITMEAKLSPRAASKRKQPDALTNSSIRSINLTIINVQRGTDIIDACRIRDGDKSSMLILTQTPTGERTVLLEAVGVSSVEIDLPNPLLVHNPFRISRVPQTNSRQEGGRGRILQGAPSRITALENASIHGRVDMVDADAHRHLLQIQLEPRNPQVKKILNTVEFVLQDKGGNGVFVIWIEAMRWLRSKENIRDLEWTAMVITIFSMIIPFASEKPDKPKLSATQRSTKMLRSSTGAAINMSRWEHMMDEECGVGGTSPMWSTCPGWQWIGQETDHSTSPILQHKSSMSSGSKTTQALFGAKRNVFVVQCVFWTREFMKSPVGDRLLGVEGILPTARTKDPESRRIALGSVVIAIHLLREEQKLDTRSSRSEETAINLAPVLAQIGRWMNWEAWEAREGDYYYSEISDMEHQVFDDSTIKSLDLPPEPFVPPSIFEFVEASYSHSEFRPFVTLLDVAGVRDHARAELARSVAKGLTPRTFALLEFFSKFASLPSRPARVQWMFQCGLNAEILATVPVGVSASLLEATSCCESSPPSLWSGSFLQLIGREDLEPQGISSTLQATSRLHGLISHEAIRDYHMIGNSILDTEPSHSWDASSEADRQGVTRLIFREDRRFQDASKLVNQLRAPVAECHPEPDWTEADLLDAQRELVQLVTMRTLTVASGRGMINYSSRVPLLTEKVPVSAFTLQCQVRPGNVTLSAERASFTEDRAVWAFFHNGTAAGLTISKDAKGIDTSWILYNKPLELTTRHAGFLLALGLNGHLKSLAKWVAFKYLTPKHTMTSIGLLLGLAASYLGTMDTLITRLLSVHVTRMLPPGAAELNLSPLTQTTGIMGIGLVYCSSQHRRMSEVMLSEIENDDVEEGVPPEQTLRDEGYRLSAGFALGFINLGQGKRLHGLHDMNVMERLLSIAIGTKNVNLVHVLDRATSGATIAFALIYMKTNDESIARKIDIPDTLHQFEYVRPDIFLLRTVARHLIMWASIRPTFDFIRASLPKAYRHRASLFDTRNLNSEDMPFFNILAGLCLALGLRFAGSGSHIVRDLLTSYLDQFIRLTRLPALNYDSKLTRNAVRNCQDVTALATAAVMAGTGDLVVFRRLRALHGRADPETPYGSHLAAHMAIGILFLGGGTYTLGTSDLAVASLLCAFYPLFPTSVMDNQAHLQAFRHLWVLAADPRCIITRDVETGRPVSVPIVVVMKNHNTDKDSYNTDIIEGIEEAPNGERLLRLTSPCLLPELDTIKEIRTDAKAYWDVRIGFEGEEGEKRREEGKKRHINVLLRRRAPYDVAEGRGGSVFVSEMQALAEAGSAPSVGVGAGSAATAAGSGAGVGGGQGKGSGSGSGNPFDWLWQLDALKGLDVSERALVLPPTGVGAGIAGYGNRYLRGTVVDTRLELECGVLDDSSKKGRTAKVQMEKDQLWQLRLLFAWVDMLDREEQEQELKDGEGRAEGEGAGGAGNWLRRELVEKLRWRVWKMGGGVEDGDEIGVEDEDEDEDEVE